MSETDRDAMRAIEEAHGPWVWQNDKQGYDEWINRLLRDCPEEWEAGDGAAEDIITQYVRTLEQRVMAAYGVQGLEPHHEGVVNAVTEMTALREWLSRNMPHVSQAGGVAAPIIALLDICHLTLANVLPIVQSVTSAIVPKLRAAGLMKRCTCKSKPPTGLGLQPGVHHEERCPMRGAWI